MLLCMHDKQYETQKALAVRLGMEFRRLRLECGKTQEDLADEARMTTNYVSLVELGQTNVTVKKAAMIAMALSVKLSEVLMRIGA